MFIYFLIRFIRTGVFEGVEHIKFLMEQPYLDKSTPVTLILDKINIKIPFSEDEINIARCEILNKNNLEEGYIRPIVYLGNEGLKPRARI